MEPIHTEIELKKLVLNTGQIEGLPANPRKIDVNAFSKLKENITNNPEMLALRGLIVYETEGGKYVVIGGNMRLRAMRELETFDKAPCTIIPPGTPVEKLKTYTVLDNQQAGDWDWAMVAEDWGADFFTDLGVELSEEDLPAKDLGLGEEVVDLLWGLLTVWLRDILSVVRHSGSIVSATRLKVLGEGEFQPGINAEGGVPLQLLVSVDLLEEPRHHRQCQARPLTHAHAIEVDRSVLTAYPAAGAELRGKAHKPSVRMILCRAGLSSHIGIDAVTEAHPAAGTAIHHLTHHIERLVGGILRENLVDLGGKVSHHISILIHDLGDVEGLLSHSFLAKSGEGSHHLLDRYVT